MDPNEFVLFKDAKCNLVIIKLCDDEFFPQANAINTTNKRRAPYVAVVLSPTRFKLYKNGFKSNHIAIEVFNEALGITSAMYISHGDIQISESDALIVALKGVYT